MRPVFPHRVRLRGLWPPGVTARVRHFVLGSSSVLGGGRVHKNNREPLGRPAAAGSSHGAGHWYRPWADIRLMTGNPSAFPTSTSVGSSSPGTGKAARALHGLGPTARGPPGTARISGAHFLLWPLPELVYQGLTWVPGCSGGSLASPLEDSGHLHRWPSHLLPELR